jgi:hypothetical protein
MFALLKAQITSKKAKEPKSKGLQWRMSNE